MELLKQVSGSIIRVADLWQQAIATWGDPRCREDFPEKGFELAELIKSNWPELRWEIGLAIGKNGGELNRLPIEPANELLGELEEWENVNWPKSDLPTLSEKELQELENQKVILVSCPEPAGNNQQSNELLPTATLLRKWLSRLVAAFEQEKERRSILSQPVVDADSQPVACADNTPVVDTTQNEIESAKTVPALALMCVYLDEVKHFIGMSKQTEKIRSITDAELVEYGGISRKSLHVNFCRLSHKGNRTSKYIQGAIVLLNHYKLAGYLEALKHAERDLKSLQDGLRL